MKTSSTTKEESDGTALTLAGMLLGAALGAAISLVYTPGTGEENRRNLRLWLHHRLEDLQDKAEGVVKRDA